MAEQLAPVPGETTTGFTAPCPRPTSYRESIRSVAWPEWRIRSTLSSRSSQSGSNYSSHSSASSSCLSNNSAFSSGSASVSAADGASELTKIAHRMVSDGYIQRMVQAFHSISPAETFGPDRVLKNWFIELDVDWVLQIREKYDLQQQLQLQDTPASWIQELVKRWIRALTIIVAGIDKELVTTIHDPPTVARFGKASISAMLAFVDTIVAIVHIFKEDKLQAALHTYMCVSSASYYMFMIPLVSLEVQGILDEISVLLEKKENRLIHAISSTMMNMRRLLIDDYGKSWAIEIAQGGGEVHRNIRFLASCIGSMRKAWALTLNSAQSHNTRKLCDVIDDTISYLKVQLLMKSKLCLDQSLGYLFLLNNSYFISQLSEPLISLDVELWSGHHREFEITPECEKYMDSYLEVSWGHVLSCIPKSNFQGRLQRWKNTSSLAKFESAFHKTYQAQKFWKVPGPQLRDAIRKTITGKVISSYRDYLKEYPELAEQVSRGSNSPEVLEQMLGDLFEG